MKIHGQAPLSAFLKMCACSHTHTKMVEVFEECRNVCTEMEITTFMLCSYVTVIIVRIGAAGWNF